VLTAETEGMTGYLLEQGPRNELAAREVATLVTQVVVHADDPAFEHPTKPIGPVYDQAEASALAPQRSPPPIRACRGAAQRTRPANRRRLLRHRVRRDGADVQRRLAVRAPPPALGEALGSAGATATGRRFQLALAWLATGVLGVLLPVVGVAVIVAFNISYWLPIRGESPRRRS
jgi:hypothetical protein